MMLFKSFNEKELLQYCMYLYGHVNKVRCCCWAHEMLVPYLVCRIDWTPHRDVIVFKNLCFHSSTRVHRSGVFKNLHPGGRFWNATFSVTVFTGYVWTVGQNGGKNLCFQTKMDTCGWRLARLREVRENGTCKNDSPKKWWQSLVKSWSHTESFVRGSLRANVVVLWYVFG